MENTPPEIICAFNEKQYHKLTANLKFFTSRTVFSENLTAVYINKTKLNLIHRSMYYIKQSSSGTEVMKTDTKKQRRKLFLFSFKIISL
jgi:hypothetical protein